MTGRELCIGAALGILCAAGTIQAQPEWLAGSFRRAVIGADAHNVDRMLAQTDEVHDSGADMVIITAHLRGWAFFPSEFAATAPDLAVPDVLGDGVARIKELGMRAVVYVHAPLIQEALAGREEWRQRSADGSLTEGPAVCILSPGHEWVLEYLCEMVRHAPLDGLWLDGYPQGTMNCFCDHCATAYREDKGLELPGTWDANASELREYVAWWHDRCAERARELVDAVHAVRPEVAVFANCSTGRNADDWRHGADELARILDGPSVEQFWHVDGQGDPLNALFAVGRLASAAGRDWVESYAPLLPHTVDCTTTLPETEVLARAFTLLAAGAVPQTTYGPGRQDIYTRLMSEIAAREPYIRDTRRVRYVGIAASQHTGLHFGRADAEKAYWHEVKGWLRALTEAKLPVELLSDAQLAEGDFGGLSCVVLPSTACLSDEAEEGLRAFVEAGGGLVGTGQVSLADDSGEPLPDFALGDVLGVSFSRLETREPLPSYFPLHPGDHALGRGAWVDDALWRQWICLGHPMEGVGIPGTCVRFAATDARDVAWRHADGESAVVAGEHAAGRVVYAGPEIGAAYYEFSYPYLRELMVESVLWSAGDEPVDRID